MKDIQNKKIFIIDDDEEISYLIKLVLEKNGFKNIQTFANSEDSFKNILFDKPDLLFLDIILPDTDGINLSEAIDAIYDQSIPTFFMSSDKTYQKIIDIHHFKRPTCFFPKPLNINEIVDKAVMVLEESPEPEKLKPELNNFKKPWPVVMIALLLMIEPLIKILYFKLNKQMDLSTIFSNVILIDAPKAFFDFWLLFPLSGILLINIRKWAYYGFLLLQIYAVWMHLSYTSNNWPFSSELPHLSSGILMFLNIGVIIYFLIPAIRRPYFDPKLRPWEKGPEYYMDIGCMIVNQATGEFKTAHLVKIAKDSATISLDKELSISTNILLNFSFYNFYFSLKGKITDHIKHEETVLFHQITFSMIQYGDKINFKKFLKALSIMQKH